MTVAPRLDTELPLTTETVDTAALTSTEVAAPARPEPSWARAEAHNGLYATAKSLQTSRMPIGFPS